MTELLGAQRPRIFSTPPSTSSIGPEAIELATLAGLELDDWQQYFLTAALSTTKDGSWSAFEIGLVCSRQNGKGSILEARELAGLFLLGEELVIHSAHEFATSLEAFRRLVGRIEDTPDLSRRVKRITRSHGDEGVELITGQRIRFRTRTGSGGRGFTANCIILDEAMVLSEAAAGALIPSLSAVDNSQVWYTGSAVDKEVHPHGSVFARVRERGLAGDDPSLVFAEWSAPVAIDQMTDAIASDPQMWAVANPALNIRISAEHVGNERLSLDLRTFATERLGVGDWPTAESREPLIDPTDWAACLDTMSRPDKVTAIAVEVANNRSTASIALASRQSDGTMHVDVMDNRPPGTQWVVPMLAQLKEHHPDAVLVLDPKTASVSLLPELAKLNIEAMQIDVRDLTQASAIFVDLVRQHRLRQLGQPVLDGALVGVERRALGDAWTFQRRGHVDRSPLLACVLACWVAETRDAEPKGIGIWGGDEDYGRLRQKMAAERAAEHGEATPSMESVPLPEPEPRLVRYSDMRTWKPAPGRRA